MTREEKLPQPKKTPIVRQLVDLFNVPHLRGSSDPFSLLHIDPLYASLIHSLNPHRSASLRRRTIPLGKSCWAFAFEKEWASISCAFMKKRSGPSMTIWNCLFFSP